MKTANTIPKFGLPGRGKRSYSKGFTYAGPTLRTKKAHKAVNREWPSTPTAVQPWEHPALSNRYFNKDVWLNWKYVIGLAAQLAWESLAATITIVNYKGAVITPTGFQLYQHFETFWKTYWYIIGGHFDPGTAVLDTGPYLPWTPPATPTNLLFEGFTPGGFRVKFDTTSGFRTAHLSVQMAIPGPHSFTPYTTRLQDVNATATEVPYPSGHYTALISWGGILPTPPKPGAYTLRLRVAPDSSPYTPSAPAETTVTIPF